MVRRTKEVYFWYKHKVVKNLTIYKVLCWLAMSSSFSFWTVSTAWKLGLWRLVWWVLTWTYPAPCHHWISWKLIGFKIQESGQSRVCLMRGNVCLLKRYRVLGPAGNQGVRSLPVGGAVYLLVSVSKFIYRADLLGGKCWWKLEPSHIFTTPHFRIILKRRVGPNLNEKSSRPGF